MHLSDQSLIILLIIYIYITPHEIKKSRYKIIPLLKVYIYISLLFCNLFRCNEDKNNEFPINTSFRNQ